MNTTTEAPAPAPAEPAPAPVPTTGLTLLRAPFEDRHISYLPKETKTQKEERDRDRTLGIRCNVCGTFHHKHAVHLDYVGHAATTNRLLDADPLWNWEPLAWTDEGLPKFDGTGGLWIKLTVCGVTRLGYGHANKKPDSADAGAREKEVIGDALRNAAMRFGVALELWHKGDLHGDHPPGSEPTDEGAEPPPPPPPPAQPRSRSQTPADPKKPAGKPAESVGVINAGQVKYLERKVKALDMDAAMVGAMLQRHGAKALDTKLTLAQFTAIKAELDKAMSSNA